MAAIMAAQQRGGGAALIAQGSMSLWQGQYPPPDAIERYQKALPGSFDRMLTMTEKRMDSEIRANDAGVAAQIADVRRGHYLGAAVTIGAMGAAIVCAAINQPVVACAFLAVPVMSVGNSLIETWRTPRQAITVPPNGANSPSTDGTPGAPAQPT